MTTEKDETFTVLVKGKPLATVKAHLIHAFLSVSRNTIYTILKSTKSKQMDNCFVVGLFLDGRTIA